MMTARTRTRPGRALGAAVLPISLARASAVWLTDRRPRARVPSLRHSQRRSRSAHTTISSGGGGIGQVAAAAVVVAPSCRVGGRCTTAGDPSGRGRSFSCCFPLASKDKISSGSSRRSAPRRNKLSVRSGLGLHEQLLFRRGDDGMIESEGHGWMDASSSCTRLSFGSSWSPARNVSRMQAHVCPRS